MKQKLLCFFMLGILLIGSAYAQERRILGRVTSAEDGAPIAGVSVLAVGTNVATQTDALGTFTIAVPNTVRAIEFRYLGFAPQTVALGSSNSLEVVLRSDATSLEEIVITGQGLGIEKKRLSTTVDVIDSAAIAAVPNVRLDQMLQGKLPSAQIKLNSGQPGTSSMIRSRGFVSANSSGTPVIYVDGVRVDNLNSSAQLFNDTGGANSSSLTDIPVENIERIEFIKGGAATTLYGSDAANGVIQIFTKKGTAGYNTVTVETILGAVSGTRDYLKYKETADILFNTGLMQSYRLSLSGGSDRTTYSFSGNVSQNDGFRPNNSEKRYNFRTTVSTKINDKFSYDGSFGFTSNDFLRDQNANSSFGYFGALETGTFGDLSSYSATQVDSVKTNFVDPVQRTVNNREGVRRFQTSQSFVYNPIENLTARATVGIDSRVSQQKGIYTNAYLIALGAEDPGTDDEGSIDVYDRNFLGLTGELNLQHRAEVNDFSFISTLGGQFFRNTDRQSALHATNVTEGSESVNNSGSTTAEDYFLTVVNYGFFGAENIGYKNKLFLEFGLRLDGNSAFGDDVGLQAYPKVGLAYDLGSEDFFRNWFPNREVALFKLRANYGKAGLFPTPFTNVRTIASNAYFDTPSFTLGQPGDPNLKPEKVSTYEAGLDIGLLSNRINLSATYYQAKTEDALFSAPFSPSLGLLNQLRNLGEISNKGWEFSANVNAIDKGDFKLNFGLSYNVLNQSEVVSAGGAPEFSIGGFAFLGAFVKEGFPVGYLRGSRPVFDSNSGEMVDVERNAFLGNPTPKNWGSFSLTFTYKDRLTLYTSSDYQTGGHNVNLDEVLRFFGGYQDDRIPEAALGENYTDLAGVFVEKSDFFKFRNISLSYRIPEKYLGNVFKGLEVGFTVMNPLNFYSATFDPEIDGSGGAIRQAGVTAGGFAYGTESAPRQYLGSLRFKF